MSLFPLSAPEGLYNSNVRAMLPSGCLSRPEVQVRMQENVRSRLSGFSVANYPLQLVEAVGDVLHKC